MAFTKPTDPAPGVTLAQIVAGLFPGDPNAVPPQAAATITSPEPAVHLLNAQTIEAIRVYAIAVAEGVVGHEQALADLREALAGTASAEDLADAVAAQAGFATFEQIPTTPEEVGADPAGAASAVGQTLTNFINGFAAKVNDVLADASSAARGTLDGAYAKLVNGKIPKALLPTDLTTGASAQPVSYNDGVVSRPTVTKLGYAVLTRAQTGLRSIYWPTLVKVPAAVYAANPTLGRWRLYYSTDHDATTGQVGMTFTDKADLSTTTAADWTVWKHPTTASAVLFTEGGSSQTETPTIAWNPFTALFHMLYQVQSGSGSSLVQFTKVATSPDGITWTPVGVALPNPPSSFAGFGHTGYAKLYLVDGLWIAWSNLGEGTEVSGAVTWFSSDGLNFVRSPHKTRGLLNWSEGTLRTSLGGLFRYKGQLWASGVSAQFTSGTATSEGQSWLAPVHNTLRSLAGRPQYVPFAASGGEASTPSIPFQWQAGDDGRLYGAYRVGAGTGEIRLAVMS